MFASKAFAHTRRFGSDENGSIAILAAASLAVIVGVAALAIDLGSLYAERRQAQGAVDLAAAAATTDIPNAEAAAAAAIAANGITKVTSLVTTRGNYDRERAIDDRFQANVTPFNAVHVVLHKTGATFFANAFADDGATIGVEAIATATQQAMFSVGSRLVGVQGGIINQLLGGLLGGSVNLSVSDYDALLTANVTMAQFLGALATDLSITAGTYNDILSSSATVGDVLQALASVTSSQGNVAANAAVTKLLTQSNAASHSITLSHLINLGSLGSIAISDGSPGLESAFKVMDLINAASTVANGGNQVTLNLVSGIPGVLSLTIDVAIGEPMQHSGWVSVGDPGATLYTSQMRLRIVAQIGGTGLLSGVTIRLPVYVNLAEGRGRLDQTSCPGGDPMLASATIAALPAVGTLRIAEVSNTNFTDFSQSPTVTAANIIQTAILRVTGQATLTVGNVAEQSLEFEYDEFGTIKSAGTQNFSQSLVQSLLGSLQLNAQILGLSLLTPAVLSNLVSTALGAVAAPIDAVLSGILSALGIHLGQLDVIVHGVRCDGSALVN